jgi:hypothetical protein
MITNKVYEYQFFLNYEKLIIKKYFTFYSINKNNIYFSITKKEIRKIKLLIINNDPSSEILLKIIQNSKLTETQFINISHRGHQF